MRHPRQALRRQGQGIGRQCWLPTPLPIATACANVDFTIADIGTVAFRHMCAQRAGQLTTVAGAVVPTRACEGADEVRRPRQAWLPLTSQGSLPSDGCSCATVHSAEELVIAVEAQLVALLATHHCPTAQELGCIADERAVWIPKRRCRAARLSRTTAQLRPLWLLGLPAHRTCGDVQHALKDETSVAVIWQTLWSKGAELSQVNVAPSGGTGAAQERGSHDGSPPPAVLAMPAC
eukprot:CAMPEP_0180799574 /NCGR_PEP_ID=MMETSP1038_2-20121128/58610_1 /TAXON_ID=632150 /ORGANISM="Azadinium spinosum, Strain 3D9" /LENGTH=234 /DNA_ID=CAMNT_0022839179 /DNA_START=14 /DNA_END=719 /DNA_ORIENTATION=-